MSHTQTPKANAQISTSRNSASLNLGARYQYMGKATSVPAVPGPFGIRPAPKPKDRKCAGWLNRNRQFGWTLNWSCKVVIAAFLNRHYAAVCRAHLAAFSRDYVPDTAQRQMQAARQHVDAVALRN